MAEKIVVGAGIWGCTVARRLADEGYDVTLIEKRGTIGGNCSSYDDPSTNIEIHEHGSHIFHTDDEGVIGFLSGFCRFNGYKHQVMSFHDGKFYQLPVGLALLGKFFGEEFTPTTAIEFLRSHADAMDRVRDAFFSGYTRKQWGTDRVDKSVTGRIPVRLDYDVNYFHTLYQGIPSAGYRALFEAMVDSPRIRVLTNTEFRLDDLRPGTDTYYSGPLDGLFGFRFGPLPWRTLDFSTKRILTTGDYQGVAVVNYPDPDVAHTRIHEYRHYRPERTDVSTDATVIQVETPREFRAGSDDIPYYPVKTYEALSLYLRYRALVPANLRVGGRLGRYRYMDMAETVRDAMEVR